MDERGYRRKKSNGVWYEGIGVMDYAERTDDKET
jgi:hypothetical protein